jgi:hypothetical protein
VNGRAGRGGRGLEKLMHLKNKFNCIYYSILTTIDRHPLAREKMYSQICKDALKKSMFNEAGYKIEKMCEHELKKEKLNKEFFKNLKEELLADYSISQLIEKIEYNSLCLYIYPRANLISQYDCIRIDTGNEHNNFCENIWGSDVSASDSQISLSVITQEKKGLCHPISLFHYWKNTLYNLDYSKRKHSTFTCVCSNVCDYCNVMYERTIKNISQIDLPIEEENIVHKKCTNKECLLYAAENSNILKNEYCTTNYVSSKKFRLSCESDSETESRSRSSSGSDTSTSASTISSSEGICNVKKYRDYSIKITHMEKFKQTIRDIIINNIPVVSEVVAETALFQLGRADEDL